LKVGQIWFSERRRAGTGGAATQLLSAMLASSNLRDHLSHLKISTFSCRIVVSPLYYALNYASFISHLSFCSQRFEIFIFIFGSFSKHFFQ
jgi:hypothetical protein